MLCMLHESLSMSRKPRLLVVDDETANLQKLHRTFVNDFRVWQAKTGEEATTLLQGQPFDVIITDQRMPGMSGVDLLRHSLDSSPTAVRIILTGYTEVEDLMMAINEGQVDRYVTKPWEPFSLRRTVIQDVEHRDLRRENQVLTEQLRIAEEVQAQLFPQVLPVVEHLDYQGVCIPARAVGGDYYDFLQLSPGRLWLAVGDISGKGISAALLMANLQALLRSHVPFHGDELGALVGDVNRLLHQTTDSAKFATLFCGVFDSATRELNYVNAGHCSPILHRPGQEVEFLQPTGTIVGMFEEVEFGRRSIELRTGDTLVVYTDGITEAANSDWEEFGEERLAGVVSRHAQLPPVDLSHCILEQVGAHSGRATQQDDLTLVVARVQ